MHHSVSTTRVFELFGRRRQRPDNSQQVHATCARRCYRDNPAADRSPTDPSDCWWFLARPICGHVACEDNIVPNATAAAACAPQRYWSPTRIYMTYANSAPETLACPHNAVRLVQLSTGRTRALNICHTQHCLLAGTSTSSPVFTRIPGAVLRFGLTSLLATLESLLAHVQVHVRLAAYTSAPRLRICSCPRHFGDV